MLEIVPTRVQGQAWCYVPRRSPSGDSTLWDAMLDVAYVIAALRLFVLRQKVAFIAYLWAWEYASTRPTATGRHAKPEAKRGPRHAAPTTFAEQLGLVRTAWRAYLALDERVETAARTA